MASHLPSPQVVTAVRRSRPTTALMGAGYRGQTFTSGCSLPTFSPPPAVVRFSGARGLTRDSRFLCDPCPSPTGGRPSLRFPERCLPLRSDRAPFLLLPRMILERHRAAFRSYLHSVDFSLFGVTTSFFTKSDASSLPFFFSPTRSPLPHGSIW